MKHAAGPDTGNDSSWCGVVENLVYRWGEVDCIDCVKIALKKYSDDDYLKRSFTEKFRKLEYKKDFENLISS